MAGSYNKIIAIGNVGRDPETKTLPSGDTVTDFSVATSERRTVNGQSQETTTWFRISAFGKLGETCAQFLRKGSYVYVEGTLSQRDWTDREGANRTSLEVRAREMRMLDKRGDNAGGDNGGGNDTPARVPAAAGAGSLDDNSMDDIPF